MSYQYDSKKAETVLDGGGGGGRGETEKVGHVQVCAGQQPSFAPSASSLPSSQPPSLVFAVYLNYSSGNPLLLSWPTETSRIDLLWSGRQGGGERDIELINHPWLLVLPGDTARSSQGKIPTSTYAALPKDLPTMIAGSAFPPRFSYG
ncbi:hypothetical protein ARMGADRAFT_1083665 [Armillaria gallica]|uniref:Uncharacterized protein n=1 Tax=Armillaria gallica TaxID=47427 RepID=A0A2H3DN73_ARMGA|nr:hypothetical protein ARMGADRAFT_1083665 [Armillaria gallica]